MTVTNTCPYCGSIVRRNGAVRTLKCSCGARLQEQIWHPRKTVAPPRCMQCRHRIGEDQCEVNRSHCDSAAHTCVYAGWREEKPVLYAHSTSSTGGQAVLIEKRGY